MANVASLRARYEHAGQGHVFQFYDTLSPADQAALVAQLSSIDPAAVNATYATALAAPPPLSSSSPSADTLTPPPASALGSVLPPHDGLVPSWRATGLAAIRKGQVGILLLAGGQGTRLGSSAPKGCYDVGLPSRKSLFQLQAERILALQALAGDCDGRMVWYIMTSGPTRGPTEDFFAQHDYFGMPKDDVVFFEQGVLPCLSKEGKFLLATPSSIQLSPDGNGGIYSALLQPLPSDPAHSVLSHAASRNISYFHTYCVDNSLVRVADPVFLGYCIARNAACGAKVVRKTDPTERVGVIAMKGGARFSVVEYSEIPESLATLADPADPAQLAFRAANIVNHFSTLAFLSTISSALASIPFHIASKKIPYLDPASATPVLVNPAAPNGVKLELFIFDVFPYTPSDQFAILEVSRAAEFSPLKNAPGTGADDPSTSRRDVLDQCRRWLRDAGAHVPDDIEVELAPAVSLSGEGLEGVQGKTIVRGGAVESWAELETLFA